MPKEQFEWMVECNLEFPRSLAATLLYNRMSLRKREISRLAGCWGQGVGCGV
ncbi:hypothetical protein WKK05_11575 [Nostoc sp. UHCC 0302]|uniref:hypothetical protein n=1 Tax=Nostoc sp. UHCC 0302 TaxID=3134896 RepID=UPI00311C9910